MKSKKPTVTIGICAYKSENIIVDILNSLSNQGVDFNLQKIIVHCEKSGDNTFAIASNWVKVNGQQKLFEIVEPKRKLGFAGSFKAIVERSESDILIELNDDIIIPQKNFVSLIVKEFEKNQNLGLAAVNLKPLPPRTFVEKAIITSINAFKQTRLSVNHGNNIYSCDGKVLALSKSFYKKIVWPKNLGLLGNVDAYLYLSCISQNFEFQYVKQAYVKHSLPSTVVEYIHWTSRNNSNFYLLQRTFGELVKKEYYLPKNILWQKKLVQLINNPLGCLFLLATSLYIKYLAKRLSLDFNPKWESLATTKLKSFNS
jgi:glycosyltransferase involved in cell wall biosynthesis